MTDINKQIIEMIKENKSMAEIANILSISEKQLYIKIKQIINYGYRLVPSYNYNSDIYYKISPNQSKEKDDEIHIKLSNTNKEFRCLAVSDMHIGDRDSDMKLMNIVYEYAIKNGIKIILNCGDIIEGDYTTGKKTIKDVNSQIEYFIKKHPYDKSIRNFVIFGNHDYHSLYFDGLDISKIIKNSRYDIVPIGYGQASVKIKNDTIVLFHKLSDDYKPIINNEKLLLSGHGHMMKTKIKDIFWLGVPTLSYKSNDNTKNVIPGFIDLNIAFENNHFEYVEAKHLLITPKIIEASQSKCKVKTLYKKR